MLRSCRATVLALVALVASQAAAKNDIRGVTTGTPLADQLAQLELDGARCGPLANGAVRCVYDDELTTMTLSCRRAPPHFVETIVYTFAFTDLTRMRGRLRDLYGLRRDRIEGEHMLDTGERLIVALAHGQGTLTIVAPPARRDSTAHAAD